MAKNLAQRTIEIYGKTENPINNAFLQNNFNSTSNYRAGTKSSAIPLSNSSTYAYKASIYLSACYYYLQKPPQHISQQFIKTLLKKLLMLLIILVGKW